MNDRARILEMLKEGKITVAEAETLLDAINGEETPENGLVEMKDKRGRKPRKLHVKVDALDNSKKAKVNISIPLSLVKTFGPMIVKNMPKDAREELDKSGVDFAGIIRDLDSIVAEASEEDIVNIDTEGEDAARVRIYLE
jgi:hypothetical protein